MKRVVSRLAGIAAAAAPVATTAQEGALKKMKEKVVSNPTGSGDPAEYR